MKKTGEIVAEKIMKLRKARGFSQERLAELADVPRRTLQNIESGETTSPGIESLMPISAALEVSIATLVGEDMPIPRELLARVIDSAHVEDPFQVAALLMERFASAPPRLRAVVLAYLFQDFEVMRKYQREIASLTPKPK